MQHHWFVLHKILNWTYLFWEYYKSMKSNGPIIIISNRKCILGKLFHLNLYYKISMVSKIKLYSLFYLSIKSISISYFQIKKHILQHDLSSISQCNDCWFKILYKKENVVFFQWINGHSFQILNSLDIFTISYCFHT